MPEWLGDGTAGAAARILAALRSGESGRLMEELNRAAEICRTPVEDAYAAERTEVLDAAIRELRRPAALAGLSREAPACLLAHLAGV